MSMITRITTILMLACALAACSNDSKDAAGAGATANAPAVTAQQDMTPEQLGEIGARISKNSAQAKQILGEHGLDEKTFEQKIRKITEDPEASKRYAAAFEKAKA